MHQPVMLGGEIGTGIRIRIREGLIPADRSGWRWMRDLVRAHPMTSSGTLHSVHCSTLAFLFHGLSGPAAVLDPADQDGININYLLSGFACRDLRHHHKEGWPDVLVHFLNQVGLAP